MKYIIILVEPLNPLNVGSVARAMMNLGVEVLRIILPPEGIDLSRTWITSKGGEEIVKKVEIFPSLAEASANVEHIIGFSARVGKHRKYPKWLNDWRNEIDDTADETTALVFGREDHGLSMDDLALCTEIVKIPVFSDYHSYNLAQSALLAMYEVRRGKQTKDILEGERGQMAAVQSPENAAKPVAKDYQMLDSFVLDILKEVKFIEEHTPSHIPGKFQELIRRMSPDAREMAMLLGMFRKIHDKLLPG